jgi:mono/diheme cytochrome c family protein
MRKPLRIGIPVGIAVLVVVGFFAHCLYEKNLTVTLPDYTPPATLVPLPQNWSADTSEWFYHTDQGTQTFLMPYEWFMAIERPGYLCCSDELLSDQAYLDRFGFIPDYSEKNATKLPIGFAIGGELPKSSSGADTYAPNGPKMNSLGLTCAACHTGRLEYKGTTFVIQGAPAFTDVNNFQNAVGASVFLTTYVPSRFNRFATRVLGNDANLKAKWNLWKALHHVLGQMGEVNKLETKVDAHKIKEGYTRLDALSRIGNTVFAVELKHPEDFVPYSAPVHFPRIWYAPWFLWVQYNGSIEQPMTRNAGEALGVRAALDFDGKAGDSPESSVEVKKLYEMESAIAGDKPANAENGFTGMLAPRWQDAKILPPLDEKRVAAGALLYKAHCQRCHLPATDDPDYWKATEWMTLTEPSEKYLDLHMVPTSVVGTDPAQAEDMAKRKVHVDQALGITDDNGKVVTFTNFGPALAQLVDKVVNRWYDQQQPPLSAADRDRMNGHRPDKTQAKLAYKARPLTGIWATPPYLHNSSVPNLYLLLSPASERPKRFWLGNREYDPVNVGVMYNKIPGAFEFNTACRGNSNAGHEFNGDGTDPKYLGPLLTTDERYALIEFLKSMDALPRPKDTTTPN